MNSGQKLPPICRHGKTAFERKLLLYFHSKRDYPIELRFNHSSGYSRDDIPDLEHPFEFIPMYEIQQRVFMFKTTTDRDRARKALDGLDKNTKRKRKRRSR